MKQISQIKDTQNDKQDIILMLQENVWFEIIAKNQNFVISSWNIKFQVNKSELKFKN